MVITYNGGGCFRVQAGGDIVIVSDPLDNRLKADIVLKTGLELKNFSFPSPTQEISGPGEYEIKNIAVSGWIIENEKDGLKTVYLAVIDEMRLCFFGNATKVDESVLSQLGEVDILFISPSLEKIAKILAFHTKRPLSEVERDSDRNFYMDSDEAKKYGIVDEIVKSKSGINLKENKNSKK